MKQQQTDAINDLREFIKAGETVYTILRHRSASGMTRWLDLYVIRDNKPRRITWLAAKAVEKGFKFYGRNGDASGWDADGGYALRQEWM